MTKDIDQIGFDTQWDELRPELGNFRAALDWAAGDRQSTDGGPATCRAAVGRVGERRSPPRRAVANRRAARQRGRIAGRLGPRPPTRPASSPPTSSATTLTAFRLWEQALAEAQAGGDRLGEVRVRRVLSTCAFVRGDVATARRHLETAIPIAIDDGNELLHAYCEMALAELLHWIGDLDGAAARIAAVLDGPVASDGPVETFAHLALAPILVDRGDYAAARDSAEKVVELAESHSMLHFTIEAHLALAEIEIAVGSAEQAAAHLVAAEDAESRDRAPAGIRGSSRSAPRSRC